MNVIDECQNHFGPLSESNRRMLSTLLDHSDKQIWNIAKRIVICTIPMVNLEMAVKRVSNQDCQDCPDPFTLRRAIRNALNKHYDFVSQPIPFENES